MSLPLMILCFLFLEQLFLAGLSQASPPSLSRLAPALYIFGDSRADTGVCEDPTTLSNVTYDPYGFDFCIGPTGRFTNGFTISDFLEIMLGLPITIHYSPKMESDETLTIGYSYASAYSGILPETGSAFGETSSLEKQLTMFNSTLRNNLLKAFNGTAELSAHLSQSFFVVFIGTNDYAYNYLQSSNYNTSKICNQDNFSSHLVIELEKQLKTLYELGARKMVVFEIGPLGCYPAILKSHKPETKCVDEINQMVSTFNLKLAHMVKTLRSMQRDATIIVAKTYSLIFDMVERPSSYGFSRIRVACCLVGHDGTGRCIQDENPCPNRNTSLFWDDYHLTEAANSVIAAKCFHGSGVCTPNIYTTLSSGQPGRRNPCFIYLLLFAVMIAGVSYF
ncbi:hypothetical protein FNV43_RR17381 [Rhamnella rubrinervis]|uniref:Uncharacterized protein n=1 Tax=Rhamnella rubrinervis TaxID=2594499 RepID=A0A8K0GVD1_9ROSA|nr:hypothetical protein FNV43_RR17381 [Rhamnella rubrinervis]